MEDNNEPKQKSKSKNTFVWLILIIVVTLFATLPFHYVFHRGLKVFTKDNISFRHTFVTDNDIDELIEEYNSYNFFEKASIRNESLHKNLTKAGIITLNENPFESDDSNEPSEDDGSLSAEDIAQEFSDNQAKADEAYKDKIIQIKGKVRRITEQSRGYAVVVYGQAMGNINCYLKDKSLVSNFTKGDRVVLKGLCEGSNGYSVVMSNCEVIEK